MFSFRLHRESTGGSVDDTNSDESLLKQNVNISKCQGVTFEVLRPPQSDPAAAQRDRNTTELIPAVRAEPVLQL